MILAGWLQDGGDADDVLVLQQAEDLQLTECALHKQFMLERSFYLFYRYKVVILVFSGEVLCRYDDTVRALSHGLDDLVLLVNFELVAAHGPVVLALGVGTL